MLLFFLLDIPPITIGFTLRSMASEPLSDTIFFSSQPNGLNYLHAVKTCIGDSLASIFCIKSFIQTYEYITLNKKESLK